MLAEEVDNGGPWIKSEVIGGDQDFSMSAGPDRASAGFVGGIRSPD